MRWLWRLMILFIFISFFKMFLSTPQPQAFITWPERQDWTRRVQWQVQQWQRQAQDLPASVQMEIKHFRDEFQPQGDGKSV
ncbi:MAG: hypothetical protein WA131_00690 [Desulfitobacteriaceae bacterium]